MSLNKMVISIIIDECQKVEERCKGYQEELLNVIPEILAYERGHLVSQTNIQKKINDKCNATAQFLSRQKETDSI